MAGALLATRGLKGRTRSVSASLRAADLRAGWFLTERMVVHSGRDLLVEFWRNETLSSYLILLATDLTMRLL